MRVVFFSKTSVTSKKDGAKYEIYRGVAQDGQPVEVFLNEEQVRKFTIPAEGVVADQKVLAEVFDSAPVVDVEFNQKGRVESVKV